MGRNRQEKRKRETVGTERRALPYSKMPINKSSFHSYQGKNYFEQEHVWKPNPREKTR